MKNYFKHNNYKSLLSDLIEEHLRIPALKSKLSKAAGIQASYLSHVLHSDAQLTPDHAWSFVRFFKLPPLESEYFLALVEFERSSNPDFRRHLTHRIASIKADALKLMSRVAETSISKMPPEFYEFYYRSWRPAAIHVALSVNKLQTEEALLQELKVLPSELTEILHHLQKYGLVEKKGTKWVPLNYDIHLAKDSPWLRIHAFNWRQVVTERVSESETLSYTDVCSLSLEDEAKIKEEWSRIIQKFRKTVKASEGEVMCCLNLDFFRISEERR